MHKSMTNIGESIHIHASGYPETQTHKLHKSQKGFGRDHKHNSSTSAKREYVKTSRRSKT